MAINNKENNTTITGKILVSDYMIGRNQLITFSPKISIGEAMQTLVTNSIAGACVLDENDHLIGMISEGDCMKKIANSRYYNIPLHDQTVEEYMDTEIKTIDGNTNIFDVANLFHIAKRNRFPVLENNKVIGQISRSDILKAALEMA